ncbi:MAG TPA: HD domain-containing protein [Polyangiaceae bacterium]|nr:HD domain-containing protein [Polyangiaceae bacterium]
MTPELEAVARAEVERALLVAPPSHDLSHVERVLRTAERLAEREGADRDVCRAAALLHELVNLPKNHPDSARSGDLCAEEAARVLRGAGAEAVFVERVADAIRDHAFSKGVVPGSLEGKILQDADRLDAIGAIGVARCIATAAEMGSRLYDPQDPLARARPLDDKAFALDHFERKLFRIPALLHTASARAQAEERVAFMRAFVAQLGREVGFDR